MTQNIEPDIYDRLPRPIPNGTIVVEDEAHTFHVYETQNNNDAPKTVYTLDKADYVEARELRATVSGSERTLTKGVDWETRDLTGSGSDDSIAFINSNTYPDEGTDFYVTYVAEPVIKRFTDAHDSEVDAVSTTIDGVIDDNQVDTADGLALDELSAIYGVVGQRGGLTDPNFRSLLRAVVPAFSANGTVPGMKSALATYADVSDSDVTITEDFTKVGYEVQISNTNSKKLSASAIREIAERADPSGVELLSPPVLQYDATIPIKTTTSTTSSGAEDQLGGETLGSDTLGS